MILQSFTFKNKKLNSPIETDLPNKVHTPLALLPEPSNDARKELEGINSKSEANKKGKKLAGQKINMFNAIELFKSNAKSLIDGIVGEVVNAYQLK